MIYQNTIWYFTKNRVKQENTIWYFIETIVK